MRSIMVMRLTGESRGHGADDHSMSSSAVRPNTMGRFERDAAREGGYAAEDRMRAGIELVVCHTSEFE